MHGVKIVDMSVMISGPLAAMILADQGAEVIKVESPGLGDVKQPAGLDIVRRLIADADVLIQNFRPGAMDRLGLGYDEVAAINPRLIYVSISGFGPDGPKSNQRVYDNVIQATSGLASVQTDPATGVPALFRTLVCDKVTSLTAAQAISAALFARERGTASGQHVVLAMLDTAISFVWPDSAWTQRPFVPAASSFRGRSSRQPARTARATMSVPNAVRMARYNRPVAAITAE